MNSLYNIIFSIEVFHEYFENGICKYIEIQPNKATEKTINRYGFKINRNENAFEFYSNVPKNISDYLNYIQANSEQDCFEFDLTSSDSNFTLYTELPTNWTNIFFYTSSDTVYENQKIVLTAASIPNSSSVNIGSVKIYFKDIIALLNTNNKRNYTIKYESRATQWRYYIINKSEMPLNNLEIVSKIPVAFEQSITVTLQNGHKALLFSSGGNYMKMSEIPKQKFDLVDKSTIGNQKGKTIFKGLPNPRPKNIGLDEGNKEKIVTSSMYVYI